VEWSAWHGIPNALVGGDSWHDIIPIRSLCQDSLEWLVKLVHSLHMLLGYSETYGSGILMMKNACRENRIPEPKYELSERGGKACFFTPVE
jgi:hypothetical protein